MSLMPKSTLTANKSCNNFTPHSLNSEKCSSCFRPSTQHQATHVFDNDETEKVSNDNEAKPTSNQSDSNQKLQSCHECRRKGAEIELLKVELEQWTTKCRLTEEANQKVRDEMRLLENEMEEMHDNFKEEESEQFEQVKQELDAALKNCKILQIRLNKSERQYNQLEQVKMMLEKQLNQNEQQQIESNQRLDDSAKSIRTSPNGDQTKLHGMYDTTGGEFVKVLTSEYDQLLRDLNDTSERERDLQEQIKYSQEEAQLKGERLQAIEAENEILLGRINKLTLANSSLRSNLMQSYHHPSSMPTNDRDQPEPSLSANKDQDQNEKVRDLCEQNEQLKLSLEVAQAECQRLKVKLGELQHKLDLREKTLQETEDKLKQLNSSQVDLGANQETGTNQTSFSSRFELECRQLRARLAHSERECRQLRSQLELVAETRALKTKQQDTTDWSSQQRRRLAAGNEQTPRSRSMDAQVDQEIDPLDRATGCSSTKCQTSIDQLDRQCRSLIERNRQLETKLQRLIEFSNQDLDDKSNLESDLFDKLKRQLEASESELAKAKSRLVELDIECGRAQRQHKRLLNSLDTCGADLLMLRRNRLPQEGAGRDAMSRQELRQAMRDLELDLGDLINIIKAKECLVKDLQQQQQLLASAASPADVQGPTRIANIQTETNEQQQVRSLRRLLDQEQLLSNNLKLDVANLERDNCELANRSQMLERERVAMEEELDKLRQLSGEFRAELEESERERQMALSKSRELSDTVERIRSELNQVRQQQQQTRTSPSSSPSSPQSTDMLLMARDLSELKVKNGFLMRQLEIAREDTTRQLEELKTSNEAQLRRAVELAQIELKEHHLQETQQLRSELSESKQKLGALQRQATRQEEEANLDRDRARAIERDWRRDKSQWQQTREQLEGQLALEKRSNEFRLKEAEASMRDKERQLTGLQDRCVQLERDHKRLQGKYKLLEEDSESKLKQLSRDLEIKSKELSEAIGQRRTLEEQNLELLKRYKDEQSSLKETCESLKRSYDEKTIEARKLTELLQSRQDQAYKERSQQFERFESMSRRINELGESETQLKLLKQRLEMQERQLESNRRDLSQLREERAKLKSRCTELEKRELISKTSSISGVNSTSYFKPFGSPRSHLLGSSRQSHVNSEPSSSLSNQQTQPTATNKPEEQLIEQSIIEKLSGKINDQRNLINMLKQQLNETQMELKQLKLLQASEKSKWQARVTLLTSRLNECEEKLTFETGLLSRGSSLIEQMARPKLELSWTEERRANSELIKQQQNQIELIVRDLKKTSQAYDLLRLQSKQLESQNNKLSRKLIEIQQESNIFSLQDRELARNYQILLEKNLQFSKEAVPLLKIVSKIVTSLDAPDRQQQQQQQSSQLSQFKSDSTDRPLRAGRATIETRVSLDSDESDNELELDSSRRQVNPSPSRLARLLAGGTKPNESAIGAASANQKQTGGAQKKMVKRVRVKCSTLGITTTEKKMLKQYVKVLDDLLNNEAKFKGQNDSFKIRATSTNDRNDHSKVSHGLHDKWPTTATTPQAITRSMPSDNEQILSDDQASQQSSNRVRWQLDSDLESESSWSLGGRQPGSQDNYRRFPQATPATNIISGQARARSLGPSLTEYESESSLASDYSLSTALAPLGRRPGTGPSGAESDSGLASASTAAAATANRKLKSSSGLRGRLTSTLRNLSRSITGGISGSASDTEQQLTTGNTPKRRLKSKDATNLKEIRV